MTAAKGKARKITICPDRWHLAGRRELAGLA
jgi:hypothetical protein